MRLSRSIFAALMGAMASASANGVFRQFNDELAVLAPAGWTEIVVNTEPPNLRSSDPFRDPDCMSLLLQAKPADDSRTARMTLVRDYNPLAQLGHMGARNLQVFLNEMALLKGYRTERFISRDNDSRTQPVILAEVIGVSATGEKRNFSCLAFGMPGQNAVKAYFEYDETDPLGRSDRDSWYGGVVSKNVHVVESLQGSRAMEMTARGSEGAPSMVAEATNPPAPAATTASASPAPSPTSSPVVTELSSDTRLMVEKYRRSLVVVEGQKGKGSGFICLQDGKPLLLTNTHVLAGNPQPKFTTMDGKVVQPGAGSLAVEHDICKLEVPGDAAGIELMGEDESPQIGDGIAVLGNSEGAGVIKPLEGKIVGIGPSLIEVDAPFVPGNSGSPIIHLKSGKVIGIATYLLIRKVNEKNEAGVDTDVRRFGYRIDSVKTWEPLNWPRFYLQADQVNKILGSGEEFVEFLTFLREDGKQLPQFSNPPLRRAVETFQSRLQGNRRMSPADLDRTRREFLGNLRVATKADLGAFDSRMAYDFFRRKIVEETKFRDELYDAFTRALNQR